METKEHEILGFIVDILEALTELKGEERSEKARRLQITITELEKIAAYYELYVVDVYGK